MAITLKLTFPAGRYHATPWGRHVNEGVPEWPPSPWRLLRAIVAVWKRTCVDVSEEQIRRILEPLLGAPVFSLPPHVVAHTRHYMPVGKKSPVEIRGGGTALVFDTFVAIGRKAPLFIGWPEADLAISDRSALARLVGNLTSFGRAEGWVHVELTEETVAWNCGPAQADAANPIPVICADPATAFDDEHYPAHDPAKLKKGLRANDRLFDCPRWHLCLDTQTIRSERWSWAPGAMWVNYTRPADAVRTGRLQIARRTMPTIARYSLDGPVLPLVGQTLPLAESVRRALMSRYRTLREFEQYGRILPPDAERFASPVFSGKDDRGEPLQGEHVHAFYLPTDDDGDGHLDHVIVHAPGGLPPDEVRAIDALRRLKVGELELSLLLVGLGQECEFEHTRVAGKSSVWVSATPFLVTRHMKRRGRKRDPLDFFESPSGRADFVKQVLREEIDRRKTFPPAVEIEPLEQTTEYPALRPLQFQLGRSFKAGDDGKNRPRGLFRIRFAGPVAGPIALGHSCHFGLGLFLPQKEAEATGVPGKNPLT